MISSYVGENSEFARQYLHGELELEFTIQVRFCLFLRNFGGSFLFFEGTHNYFLTLSDFATQLSHPLVL